MFQQGCTLAIAVVSLTSTTVTDRLVRDGEFGKVESDHLGLDLDLVEDLEEILINIDNFYPLILYSLPVQHPPFRCKYQ